MSTSPPPPFSVSLHKFPRGPKSSTFKALLCYTKEKNLYISCPFNRFYGVTFLSNPLSWLVCALLGGLSSHHSLSLSFRLFLQLFLSPGFILVSLSHSIQLSVTQFHSQSTPRMGSQWSVYFLRDRCVEIASLIFIKGIHENTRLRTPELVDAPQSTYVGQISPWTPGLCTQHCSTDVSKQHVPNETSFSSLIVFSFPHSSKYYHS